MNFGRFRRFRGVEEGYTATWKCSCGGVVEQFGPDDFICRNCGWWNDTPPKPRWGKLSSLLGVG